MLALLVTLGAAGGSWWLTQRFCLTDELLRGAASAYASVGVTMLGFMLAMLAVLVSVSDRRLLRNMNRTGHLRRLLEKVYWTGAYFGVSMVASLAGLFLSSQPLGYFMSFATGTLVGALYLLFFVGRSFWRVLTIAPEGDKQLE